MTTARLSLTNRLTSFLRPAGDNATVLALPARRRQMPTADHRLFVVAVAGVAAGVAVLVAHRRHKSKTGHLRDTPSVDLNLRRSKHREE